MRGNPLFGHTTSQANLARTGNTQAYGGPFPVIASQDVESVLLAAFGRGRTPPKPETIGSRQSLDRKDVFSPQAQNTDVIILRVGYVNQVVRTTPDQNR